MAKKRPEKKKGKNRKNLSKNLKRIAQNEAIIKEFNLKLENK